MRSVVFGVAIAFLAVMAGFAQNPGAASPPAEPAGPAAPRQAAAPPPTATAQAQPEWNFARYSQLVQATGRAMKLPEGAFTSVQERKAEALSSIESYLKGKFGQADPVVLDAFRQVPREYFCYNYEGKYSFAGGAYEAEAKPWGIGYGSALSDYLGQAYMTQLSKPRPGEVALEIGTGSGFQASILSRIVKDVYSIEIIEPLGNAVGQVVRDIGYPNVHTKVGDGYYGWPEVAGGFDIILVTCAALHVPPPLLEQLRPSGRMVIPVGPPMRGKQVLYVYTKDQDGKVRSRRDMGTYFVPMTGAMLDKNGRGT
jgi:protein-L-isoaspartate(D-aspartate) O-methyltransferase